MIDFYSKKFKRIFFVFIVLLLFQPVFSQSLLQKTIDFKANQVNLLQALKLLSKSSEVNFTYNPAIIPNVTINADYNEQSLAFILNHVLTDNGLAFEEISGQVIIFKQTIIVDDEELISSQIEVPVEQVVPSSPVVIVPGMETVQKVDTVIVHKIDTLFIRDTLLLVQTDTLWQTDTLFVCDSSLFFDKMYGAPSKFRLSTDILGSYQANVKSSDVLNEPSSDLPFSIMRGSCSGYSFLAKTNVHYQHFSFQTGLGYQEISQKMQSVNATQNGYFVNDTIEQYYTGIQNNDTNWHYIVREKWIVSYDSIISSLELKHKCLLIPLMLGYNSHYKKFYFELSAGLMLELPINTSNTFLNTMGADESMHGDLYTLKYRNPNASLSVSFSCSYLMSNNLSIVLQPYYYTQLQAVFENNVWFNQKYSCVSAFLGFKYFFNRN